MKIKFNFLSMLLCCMLFAAAPVFAANPVTPVPNNVKDFGFLRAHRQGSAVALSWSSAAQGVDHFRIERSYDGEFFDFVSNAPALSGTSRFKDVEVFPGTIYYRVIAVDANGSETSSPIVAVRLVRRG